jgi:hypothetical protein
MSRARAPSTRRAATPSRPRTVPPARSAARAAGRARRVEPMTRTVASRCADAAGCRLLAWRGWSRSFPRRLRVPAPAAAPGLPRNGARVRSSSARPRSLASEAQEGGGRRRHAGPWRAARRACRSSPVPRRVGRGTPRRAPSTSACCRRPSAAGDVRAPVRVLPPRHARTRSLPAADVSNPDCRSGTGTPRPRCRRRRAS